MPSSRSSLVASARREAILCGVVFVCALAYTVTTCVRMGYHRAPDEPLKFVLGFPDWVFWGILAPWGVCTVISGLFSFVIMQDHEFEQAAEPTLTDDAALGDGAAASDASEGDGL